MRKTKFKPHLVKVSKFGKFGYALILPPSAMTPKQYEESSTGQYEIQVDADPDMSSKDFNATMAYVRRALAAYKRAGGR